MVLGTWETVLAGVAVLLLVGVGAVLVYLGLRARADAAATIADNENMRGLLDGSPAVATIVRSDGRVEMPRRMADWLGIPAPRYLADLAGDGSGLSAEDAAALTADVTAAQRAGRPFVRAVRPVGSTRAITLRGGRAPGGMGATGSVLIWAFDATDSESEINRLGAETARLGAAFDALTGLIEAAPMPMSMVPHLIALAMSTQACRPDEHCLFSALTAVELGKPAARAAARNSVAPPPGARTLPTAMSSTSEGSMPERSMRLLKAPTRSSAPGVSLKPQRPPFVMAVRRAAVTTMSSGCFSITPGRPEPDMWWETCSRRRAVCSFLPVVWEAMVGCVWGCVERDWLDGEN